MPGFWLAIPSWGLLAIPVPPLEFGGDGARLACSRRSLGSYVRGMSQWRSSDYAIQPVTAHSHHGSFAC